MDGEGGSLVQFSMFIDVGHRSHLFGSVREAGVEKEAVGGAVDRFSGLLAAASRHGFAQTLLYVRYEEAHGGQQCAEPLRPKLRAFKDKCVLRAVM